MVHIKKKKKEILKKNNHTKEGGRHVVTQAHLRMDRGAWQATAHGVTEESDMT